jgi:hypothetical protein
MIPNQLSLTRRICIIGTDRAVFLPKGWLDAKETTHGKIQKASLEVGETLTVKPVLEAANDE